MTQKSFVNRELRTPVDEFLAATAETGTLNSGHDQASGLLLISTSTSSLVEARLLSVEMANDNSNIVTVELRDGQFGATAAPRVLGPIEVKPISERQFTRDTLIGRRAQSNLFAVIVSGPSSQGVLINVSYIRDSLDVRE